MSKLFVISDLPNLHLLNINTSIKSDEFLPIPFPREFGSSSDSFVPHDGEVGCAGKVLSDGNGCVQVENNMPPSTCRHTATSH